MKIKKIGLSLSVCVFAIAAAIASDNFAMGPGYTNLQQVPDQGSPCVYRQYCGGGYNTCRVTLSSGKTVQLLQLESNGTCSSQVLSQP